MKKLFLALVLFGALAQQRAEACECPFVPADQLARSATMFFVGETRIPREVVPEGGASFGRSLIWKGPRLTTPIVAGNRPGADASCAAEFYLSATYNVLAYGSFDTGYYTDKCLMARLNTEGPDRDRILFFLSMHFMKIESFLQENGIGQMQSLNWLRKMGNFYLEQNSPEQAQRYFRHAAIISRNSVLDLQGEGESFLQLQMGRQALTRFDDVLEKDSTRQDAWQGRHKALALLGRWSELDEEKIDLTGFVWRNGTLAADLDAPVFTKAWWMMVKADGRKLVKADFSRAELSAVSFKGADLTGADFRKARLYGVDFSGATLKDAVLTGVNYEQVTWPEGFTPPASSPLDIPVPDIQRDAPVTAPSVGQQNATGR
mgnify:FL=1